MRIYAYRKIPLISPWLVQVCKGLKRWAYNRGGFKPGFYGIDFGLERPLVYSPPALSLDCSEKDVVIVA